MLNLRAPSKGTCMQMCPAKEIESRTRLGLLHKFEVKSGSERFARPRADLKKVVKQYVRSNANQTLTDSADLRPGPVLIETVDYLLEDVASMDTFAWNVAYDYIFDRLRAVRQDMAVQCIQGADKIYILERCVLFHLFSSYFLCEEPMRIFDAHTNDIHLRDCLDTLLVQYSEYRSISNRRCTFESIFVLRNLGSTKALSRYVDLPPAVRLNSLVKKCYRLSILRIHRNFYKILSEISSLPNVLMFAVNEHLGDIQQQYLRVIAYANHSPNCRFPLLTLTKWLCPFELPSTAETIVRMLCEEYGFEIVDRSFVRFKKNVPEVNRMVRRWGNVTRNIKDLTL